MTDREARRLRGTGIWLLLCSPSQQTFSLDGMKKGKKTEKEKVKDGWGVEEEEEVQEKEETVLV